METAFDWARMVLIVALNEIGEADGAAAQFDQPLARTTNFSLKYFGQCWGAIPAIRDRYVKAFTALGLR